MEIPGWADKYVNERVAAAIEDAVRQAESTTSAELVPVIVRRSSSIGHVSLCVMLVYWLLFLLLRIDYYQTAYIGWGHWIWLIYAGLGVALSSSLSRWEPVQRLFIHKNDQIAQVMRRAQLEFYQSRIQKTVDATGILFFISLLERHAVVLADRAIADKLPPHTWQQAVDTMVSSVTAGDLGSGVQKALFQAGQLLAPLLPISPSDRNELPDALVIKE